MTQFQKSRINQTSITGIGVFVSLLSEVDRTMRKLSGTRLLEAMQKRGWTNEDLARELRARGYDVDPNRIIKKWCNGKLQPSAERIDLIEQTLGYVITEDPKPRRTFGHSSVSLIAA